MVRFAIKKIKTKPLQDRMIANSIAKNTKETKEEKVVTKDKEMMDTKDKVALANKILGGAKPTAKRIKKDKGLIERVESDKIILTEDNKELLKD